MSCLFAVFVGKLTSSILRSSVVHLKSKKVNTMSDLNLNISFLD